MNKTHFLNGKAKLTEEEKKAKRYAANRSWRKNNRDKVQAYARKDYKKNTAARLASSSKWKQDNLWSSHEALTKNKCSSYFGTDRNRGLPNDFKNGVEMAINFNQKVAANRKRNNGQVLCEATNVLLTFEKNSFFQISYDRVNNKDLGHSKDNVFVTFEAFNTCRKDKFSKEEMIEGFIKVAVAMGRNDPKIAKRILKGIYSK